MGERDDDYEYVSVRIYRKDWRTLHRVQMEREAEHRGKPSLTVLLSEAVKQMAGSR
jgi:hypothetical protein